MQEYKLDEVAKKIGIGYYGALLIVKKMGIHKHGKRYSPEELKEIKAYHNAHRRGYYADGKRRTRCATAQIEALDSRVLALENRIAMLEAKMKPETAPEFERYTVTMKADQPKKKLWGIF